jgi:hypothetical protein
MGALLLLGSLAGEGAMGLQAGTARVNITPTPAVGVPMVGYTAVHDKLAGGIHDSLYARVAVLDDGKQRIAVVALDLLGFNPGNLADRLRQLGLTGWLFNASHTHGGPMVVRLDEPYGDDRTWPPTVPYLTWLEERLVAGVRQALAQRQPVRAAVGWGQVDLSFNRRLVHADGSVEMIWHQNAAPRPLGPVDPRVGVVSLQDESGAVVAVLAHYACHAVVLGSANRQITADYPGYTAAYLERRFPGSVALFLQGAAGDLDPYTCVQSDFVPARTQGEVLGREVERVVRAVIGPDAGEAMVPPDANLHWAEFSRAYERAPEAVAGEGSVTVTASLLALGDRVAWVALPGEPFVDLQLDLAARSSWPYTFLLGYTNGYAGYLPTLAASRQGGYGAEPGATLHLASGAGEAMVNEALDRLARWAVPPGTAVGDVAAPPPTRAAVGPVFPNPFNAAVAIPYTVATAGPVRVAVSSAAGQRIRLLVDGPSAPGSYQIIWDGVDASGRPAASGTYVVRLDAGGETATRRLLLLR